MVEGELRFYLGRVSKAKFEVSSEAINKRMSKQSLRSGEIQVA